DCLQFLEVSDDRVRMVRTAKIPVVEKRSIPPNLFVIPCPPCELYFEPKSPAIAKFKHPVTSLSTVRIPRLPLVNVPSCFEAFGDAPCNSCLFLASLPRKGATADEIAKSKGHLMLHFSQVLKNALGHFFHLDM